MSPQIGILGALLGGVLTLVSPCSALLLPSFFAYAFDRLGPLLARTAAFYLGLAAVLVPLGAGIGAVGSLLTRYRGTVTTVAGVLMIALGLMAVFGGGFRLKAAADKLATIQLKSTVSVVLLGAVYGLAGFCAGPLLGSVLTISVAGGSAWYGGLLMAVYALGMALPLFLLALVWDRLQLSRRRWVRSRKLHLGPVKVHSTSLISGALFIAIGMLFLLTEGTANLGGITGVDTQYDVQSWLQDIAVVISDVTVLFVVALLVLIFLAVRMLRRHRTAEITESDDRRPSAQTRQGQR